MSEIKNKTTKPVSVPLLRGKTLFLGPGLTGQVAPKALDNPKLRALVEDGTIEIVGENTAIAGSSAAAVPERSSAQGAGSGNRIRRSGDR
jgi:hypothetical protein